MFLVARLTFAIFPIIVSTMSQAPNASKMPIIVVINIFLPVETLCGLPPAVTRIIPPAIKAIMLKGVTMSIRIKVIILDVSEKTSQTVQKLVLPVPHRTKAASAGIKSTNKRAKMKAKIKSLNFIRIIFFELRNYILLQDFGFRALLVKNFKQIPTALSLKFLTRSALNPKSFATDLIS